VNIPSSKLKVSLLEPSPTSEHHDILSGNGLLLEFNRGGNFFPPTPEEANCLVAVDNQIAALQGAMDTMLSVFTVLDIIGEVVGDPGEVLTDYKLWAVIILCA
jgi:hypothetical protein